MALIKCKECGHSISKQADTCPNCGHKKPRSSGCATVLAVVIALFAVLFLIGRFSQGDESTVATPIHPVAQEPKVSAEILPSEPKAGEQWMYRSGPDEMSGKTAHIAVVESTNTLHFDFPYSGPQKAKLMLRAHPRHGKDVIVSIEQGQFLCRSYEECTVLVRFDDGQPQKFSAIGPSDGDSTTFFIRNYNRFVSGMMKAKIVRISAEVYRQGSPILEFNVDGFDQARYLPPQ